MATSLTGAVHITHDLWAKSTAMNGVRGVVFFARHCLGALELGNPQAAGEALMLL